MKQPVRDIKDQQTILIIDFDNTFAASIVEALPDAVTSVVVCKKKLSIADKKKDVLQIPFKHPAPVIPNYAFSKIIVVYHGEKAIARLIAACASKVLHENTKLVIVTNLFFAFDKVVVASLREKHVQRLIYGDIFGKKPGVLANNTINRLLSQAVAYKRIHVTNSGLNRSHPVLYDDVVLGILVAVFGSFSHTALYLLPKHPPTELAIARTIQRIDPLVRLDFARQKNSLVSFPPLPEGIFLLEERYALERKLRDSGALVSSKQSQTQAESLMPSQSLLPNKAVRVLRVLLLVALGILLLPMIITAISAGIGASALVLTKTNVEKNQFHQAARTARLAQQSFHVATTTNQGLVFQLSLVGQKTIAGDVSRKLEDATMVADIASLGFAALREYEQVFMGKTSDPRASFLSASNSLKGALVKLQDIQTENKILRSDLQQPLTLLAGIVDVLPEVLGFEGKKKYLVLFQNNMELRPGGGFLGSYGLASMENGRVSDFAIYDVYDADGQLKGHIEPPYPIRRYLPSVHLYMRDSNFSTDFPTNASAAANFLFLETGEKVDGVIGVDVSFVRGLIAAIGSLRVPDYKETVTPDNLYLLTQTKAEKDFFPGSTQKKDFLRSLFTAIKIRLSETPASLPSLAIAKAVSSAISQKHILFAFPDASLQKTFAANDMSSSLSDNRQNSESAVSDFLGISEANIGINKVNYFIKRKIEQQIVIGNDGTIASEVTIRLRNTSQKHEWPGGDYKNYLRLIVPKGAVLRGIAIDGVQQEVVPAVTDFLEYEAKNFSVPTGLEVETKEENGKTTFGFLLVVPVNAFKTISVSYDHPQQIPIETQQFVYDYWFFKQPGTDAYPLTVTITSSDAFQIFRKPEEVRGGKAQVMYKKDIDSDVRFQLHLARR